MSYTPIFGFHNEDWEHQSIKNGLAKKGQAFLCQPVFGCLDVRRCHLKLIPSLDVNIVHL